MLAIKKTEDKMENKNNTMQEERKLELEGQPEVSNLLAIKNREDKMENKDNTTREKRKLELEGQLELEKF